MTSLIDIIFLLLLFFMLTSTFSKFSEVELMAAGSSATPSGEPPLFLRLQPQAMTLNGRPLSLATLAETLTPEADPASPRILIVALTPEVTAQRLTDLLVALRGIQGLRPTVLGAAT